MTGSPAPAITTDLGAEDECEWSFAENDKFCNKLSRRHKSANSYALQLVLGRPCDSLAE